jgi:tape measure domain-containing protein
MAANEVVIVVKADDRASGQIKGIQASAVAMGAAVGLVAVEVASRLGDMAVGAATAGIKFNAMKEQAQIAFTSMLGSGRAAKTFLDELQSFAAKTPFEFPDLLRGSQKLLAMGFAAKDLIPTMTSLGDAAAAMGGSSEMIDRLTLAMGQMLAKGKVSGEEMRQFAEAGIPAWDMLATKMGISIPEAMKKSEMGAIDAATGIAALTEGMNARFGGMMDQQSRTFNGLVSTMKDNARIFAGEVTAPMFDDLKGALVRFMSWFESNREQIKSVFQDIFTTIREVVKGVTFVVTTLGPVLWDGFGKPMWEVAKQVIAAVRYIHDNWREIGNSIIGVVENMVNGIIDGLNKALDRLGDFIEMIGKIPGAGKLLGIPDGQVLENAFGSISLPRLSSAAPGEVSASISAGLTETGREFKSAAGLGGVMGGGGSGGSNPLAESWKRVQETLRDEMVKTWLKNGEEQARIVEDINAATVEEVQRTAERIHQTLGVDMAESVTMAFEFIRDREKALAEARIKNAEEATAALIKLMEAEAELAKKRAQEAFELTKELWAGHGGAGMSAASAIGLAQLADAASKGITGSVDANGVFTPNVTNNNITVSGIVGDPVATGQAIAEAINAAATSSGAVISSGAVE